MTYPKWFEKDGVKKLFNEKPTEIGWEPCAGHYDFARGVWVEDKKAPVAAEGKEELKGLREHYKKVMGKKPFNGWSADELRAKMDAAGK